ncbi:MAG TPA: hypothetical protein VMW15_04790 [Terracidiphilus sp.]|nr:hypothetical protein [Terracidiphilus sp.]
MNNVNPKIRIGGKTLRIARLDAELYHFLRNPQEVIDRLRNAGDRIDLFTFLQGFPDAKPKFIYPMEWDNLAVLPISNFDKWWTTQINGKTRNMARLADKKGVVIREVPFDESLVRGIWEIYNESPMRQGRRFPHYGKDMDAIYKDEATYLDSSIFIGAFQGEELIGFIKMVADELGVQAGLMNILSKLQHRDKAPTNALIAQAVKSCAERGIDYLVYANFTYGRKQHDGLREFKERNGFKRVDVPRYYVPLTRFGDLALHMGFHRRLIDRIPEPIAAKLHEIRRQMYDRKVHTNSEAF